MLIGCVIHWTQAYATWNLIDLFCTTHLDKHDQYSYSRPSHLPQKTRHSEAESWFSKARALAPDDREVHLHYGMFLLDAERNSEAAQHFVIAAKAADDEHAYEATFNAAVAFRWVRVESSSLWSGEKLSNIQANPGLLNGCCLDFLLFLCCIPISQSVYFALLY